MGTSPRYDKGDWKAICDVCGREYKASQLQLRWDALMVCKDDWEPRQPQDFVRGVADIQAVPWARNESSDSFIAFCTIDGISSICDYSVSGCATSEYVPPIVLPVLPCIPLFVTSNTDIPLGTVQWCCSYLEVDNTAVLSIEGFFGVT